MSENEKRISTKQAYKTILTEYPDALNVNQVAEILRTSRRTVYMMLKESKLDYVLVGRKYMVSKIDLIKFLLN